MQGQPYGVTSRTCADWLPYLLSVLGNPLRFLDQIFYFQEMATPLLPTLKWAQRADKLFITIDVQDCKSPQIELTNDDSGEHGRLAFRGEGAGASHSHEKDLYALDLEFCGAIDPDGTKVRELHFEC